MMKQQRAQGGSSWSWVLLGEPSLQAVSEALILTPSVHFQSQHSQSRQASRGMGAMAHSIPKLGCRCHCLSADFPACLGPSSALTFLVIIPRGSDVRQIQVKNLPAVQESWVWSLGQEDPREKGMATYSSILAWKIPWTEEPGGLQSMGSQRVRHDWVMNTFTFLVTLVEVCHRTQFSLPKTHRKERHQIPEHTLAQGFASHLFGVWDVLLFSKQKYIASKTWLTSSSCVIGRCCPGTLVRVEWKESWQSAGEGVFIISFPCLVCQKDIFHTYCIT